MERLHNLQSMRLFGLDQSKDVDLTPYVVQARRGLRRDVKALADALPKGKVFVPLAERLKDVPPAVGNQLIEPYKISVHTFIHPETQGRGYPIFTRLEFLVPFEAELGWKTDGGPLRYANVSPKSVFDLVLPDLKSKRLEALLVNPFRSEMLELEYGEAKALADNQPIPFMRYLRELPVQEGEKFDVGAPAVRPSRELVDTIHSFVASHPDLIGYDLFQMFNADRDIEPHLALNIVARQGTNEPEAAREIHLAIQKRVQVDKYVDIVFNTSFAKGIAGIDTFRKSS